MYIRLVCTISFRVVTAHNISPHVHHRLSGHMSRASLLLSRIALGTPIAQVLHEASTFNLPSHILPSCIYRAMDPFTILGAASASLSIISNLVPALLKLKEHWTGIGKIDETNTGFIEELDAFESSLVIFETELRKYSSSTRLDGWWDIDRMNRLLANASKTVSRLESMFLDVGRKRKFMQNMRAYYRASMYDKEVGHLLLRIKTYTMSLSMPIMLRAM
jgi:hypothetical protein